MRRVLSIIKCILFFALLFAVVFAAALITERKASTRKYADLHAAAPLADVLFLGSSHVINGVNPVQLYEEYGIAAYNLGGHGSILPVSYYELLCALDDFSPRFVVVDGYMMERDYHYLDEMTEEYDDEARKSAVSQLHLSLDIFPLSRAKLYAVRDLIADRQTQAQFLFPFLLYHNRWSTLTGDDFTPSRQSAEANRLLGAEIRTGVAWQIAPHTMGDEDAAEETVHLGEQYLQMILQTCRERGINVAFTFLPCNSTATDRRTAQRLDTLAAAEAVPCLNLLNGDIVDFSTDFNDEGHLNLLGMTKVTHRIGAFLTENVPLPDRRGDPAYALWMTRAEEYGATRRDILRDAHTLSEALLALCADRRLNAAILYLSGTGAAIGDPAVRSLLDALAPGNRVREAAAAGEPALIVLPAGEGGALDFSGYQVAEWQDTALGPLEVIQAENFTGVYLRGDESDNLLDMEDARLADAQLVLLSTDAAEIEKRLIFNYADSISDDTE